MGKWQSFPEGQQTPVCGHLLGLAVKAIPPLALGERFRDDAEVIRFRKNHDAVSNLIMADPHTQKHTIFGVIQKNVPGGLYLRLFGPPGVVRDR